MKAKLALCLLALCHTAYARERLRISEVTDSPAGEGVETLILGEGGTRETIHVKKEAIITEADVSAAWPQSEGPPGVSVQLKDSGAEKMARATAQPGRRLAVIVDGVLLTAPTVQTTLNAAFFITIPKARPGEAVRLAAKISGQPEESFPEPRPKVTPQPLSDEEYKALREEREKAGIHYLDKTYSEEELAKSLHKGMTFEEVTAVFGPPESQSGPPGGEFLNLIYSVAPERRLPNPKRDFVASGFSVGIVKGRVHHWGVSTGNADREGKRLDREPSKLKVILPPSGFTAAERDKLRYLEEIRVLDLNQPCAEKDLAEMVTLIAVAENHLKTTKVENPSIDAGCDVIKLLALHIPVVADLQKSPENGRIPLAKLVEKLHPYIFEGRPIPVRPPAK